MNLKSSSRQGPRKIAGRNRIARNRRWRLLRISKDVSYAILPGGKRMLVHDPAQSLDKPPVQKARSSSRVIGNTGYSRLNKDTNSLTSESSVAVQEASGPNPDSWGIMEEPLLPVGEWMPAIRLGVRPTDNSGETPIQAPEVSSEEKEKPLTIQPDTGESIPANLPPVSLKREVPPAPAQGVSAGQTISAVDGADEDEDSLVHTPAPGGRPDRSGGIVGFLSRIFKT